MNFNESKFDGKTEFLVSHFFENADFRNAHFMKDVDFYKSHFYNGVNFNEAKFIDSASFKDIKIEKYKSFEMVDTYFYDVTGLLEFIEEDKKKGKKKRTFKYPKKPKLEFLPENFRLILGEKATARYPVFSRQIRDDMYLLDKKERISKMHGIRKFRDKTLYCLWWLFANYGRSFWKWALWSLGFAIAFAFVYYFSYIDNPLNFQTVYVFEKCPLFSFIYYSIVTFTTLGFGDIVPRTGCLQFWVMFEVLLGYIMLGGLISIFANRLARRS